MTKAPTCATCGDTHRMTLGDREVPCTRCPLPCGHCGFNAYCKTTPCPCACHDNEEQRATRLAALEDVRRCAIDALAYIERGVHAFPERERVVTALRAALEAAR